MTKFFALAVAFAGLSFLAFAEDKKADKKADTKTIEGTMVCTKCTLKETKTCGHAVKVKDGDKEVTYYIDDKGAKETYHKGVCPADSEAKVKVTGKVTEKDGKKHITDAKVEVVK